MASTADHSAGAKAPLSGSDKGGLAAPALMMSPAPVPLVKLQLPSSRPASTSTLLPAVASTICTENRANFPAPTTTVVGHVPHLSGFHMFGSAIRDQVRLECPTASGKEVQKIICERWKKLSEGEKTPYLQRAQSYEQQHLIRADQQPNSGQKRKRGRPRKVLMAGVPAAQPMEKLALPALAPGGEPQKAAWASSAPQQAVVGKSLSGRVDGTFDAGYFITADIEGNLYRGILYVPGLMEKITPVNDIAPAVKSYSVHPRMHVTAGSTGGEAAVVDADHRGTSSEHEQRQKEAHGNRSAEAGAKNVDVSDGGVARANVAGGGNGQGGAGEQRAAGGVGGRGGGEGGEQRIQGGGALLGANSKERASGGEGQMGRGKGEVPVAGTETSLSGEGGGARGRGVATDDARERAPVGVAVGGADGGVGRVSTKDVGQSAPGRVMEAA